MRGLSGFIALGVLFPSVAFAQASATAPGAGSPFALQRAGTDDAQDRGVSIAVGGSYATGDFGTATNTDIWTVPVVARVRAGGLRLSASLPWMSITSDGTLFTGIDSTPLVVAPGIKSTRRRREGFGDLTLGAAYSVPTIASTGLDVELSARVKLPTATAGSQLSTGKNDYAFGAQVSKTYGNLVPFVSGTYRIFGDSGPWDLRNGMAASVGASYVLPGRATVIASYDYAKKASGFVSDSHEMFGGLSLPLGRSPLRLTAFGTVGLSRSAPDASGGLSVTASF